VSSGAERSRQGTRTATVLSDAPWRVTTATHHAPSVFGTGLTPHLLPLLLRIKREYHEMPGLSLTEAQARRMWGLDRRTCTVALGTLTELRVLQRTTRGCYVQSSG